VSSCSKGPRGLSVLPRVGGIFTSTTISLDLWPRQLPSRYRQIINEIFEAIELKNFIPFNYLKYLLYFMYYEQKNLKDLNKYAAKIGEKTKKPIWFRGKARKGIIIKINNLKENKNDKYNEIVEKDKIIKELRKELNEKDELIKELKKELDEKDKLIEELKREIENLKNPISLF
jgi:hypothetical protein